MFREGAPFLDFSLIRSHGGVVVYLEVPEFLRVTCHVGKPYVQVGFKARVMEIKNHFNFMSQ